MGELFDLGIAMACPKRHTSDKARLTGRGCRVGEDARVAIRHYSGEQWAYANLVLKKTQNGFFNQSFGVDAGVRGDLR